MADTATTKPEEFAKFISLLPMNPYLIPLKRESKDPDIPKGESWKDPKYKLTTDQAYARLCAGLNVGVVASEGLLIFDLDDPEKYVFQKETTMVKTRNGKLHKFFLNDGTVENAVGKGKYVKCGEVRASWQYVVCVGSYVPPDSPNGDGVYRVVVEREPVTLSASELPDEFKPTSEATQNITATPTDVIAPYKNHNGLTLEEIRAHDSKLDKLLKNDNSDYPSASEADMATLSKLLYFEYSSGEALAILLLFRDREKLRRADYLQATMSKISVTDTYTQHDEGEADESPDMKETLESIHSLFLFKTPTDIEEIYVYNNGIYEPGEHKIKEYLENQHEHKITSHYVSEVLDHIRRSSYADRSDFNKASVIVPVANGLLNLSTLTLEPFTPDRIFTYKLNAEYKPEAKSPQWQAFIKEVVDGEDLPALQEYLGYCLVPSMPFHKLMWFYGAGRNGKGTVIRTLEELFGKKNCSHLELEDFRVENRFRLAILFGKAINISSEPGTHKTLQTQILKKIAGEDTIDAEIKNKQNPIVFSNCAKPFIIGNRFPKVNDDTVAFWERILFTNFPKSYLGEKAIPDIEHRWTKNPEEMSGLLNWMIEGLIRLLQNGTFTASKTTEQTKILFKRVSDTPQAFIDEQCERFPQSEVTRIDMYEAYKNYCESHGLAPESERVLVAKLDQLIGVKTKSTRVDGKKTRVWVGLRVKPLPDDTDGEEAMKEHQTELSTVESGTDGTHISPPQNSKIVKREEEVGNRRVITGVPSVPEPEPLPVCTGEKVERGVPTVPSLLESNGEAKGYKQQNQTAYVSHIKAGEPCFSKCGLASEWSVKIEPDLEHCFCNDCFQKAKRDLEWSGFRVEFKEAERP
jgi:P4 family phage/plasmid primase-like protien